MAYLLILEEVERDLHVLQHVHAHASALPGLRKEVNEKAGGLEKVKVGSGLQAEWIRRGP